MTLPLKDLLVPANVLDILRGALSCTHSPNPPDAGSGGRDRSCNGIAWRLGLLLGEERSDVIAKIKLRKTVVQVSPHVQISIRRPHLVTLAIFSLWRNRVSSRYQESIFGIPRWVKSLQEVCEGDPWS